LFAKETDYIIEGIKLFNKQEYNKSKIYFEKDIVFNPKSEKSYLYLAKIFEQKNDDDEEERNLQNVLLINPINEEAIYMLTLLKIRQFDYVESKKLIEKFKMVCDDFCSKSSEMKNKLKKIIPEK